VHKDIISIDLEDDSTLKHAKNIKSIVDLQTTVDLLKDWEPALAGGFPMSLLFAPRRTENKNKIQRGFYHDFDFYFKSSNDLEAAAEKLLSNNGIVVFDSPNAKTIKLNNKEHQLIKIYMEQPVNIIVHYDFVNCAVAYTPHNRHIYFHKDTLRWHLEKKLQILNPWMLTQLNSTEEDITNNIVIQLLRFAKYCARWNYILSKDSLFLLLEIYHKYPDIKIRDQIYIPIAVSTASENPRPTSSWTTYLSIGSPNQNIWEAMAHCIFNADGWSDTYDNIGIIKTQKQIQETEVNF